MKATVWTARRKWLGNVVPSLFWFPLAAIGVYLVAAHGQFLGTGLWFLAVSTIAGWLAVNQFGFFENAKMRRTLELILKAQGNEMTGEFLFVGFATPKYSSMVDAHEDVGFLEILEDRICFVSETRKVEIQKVNVSGVGTYFNVHSLLGLGGWVGVDALVGDKRIRMLIEPRERPTLLGSKSYRARLAKRLREWAKA
ncbi:MAG: hypothetical protein P4L46_21475 [Fimbriimonas sp.]|nr:hypothetical protein [Fimbriimonas sp.]